jgi:hypothetical protein
VVRLIRQDMRCHRCGSNLLLTVQLPHPRIAHGLHVQPLCQHCDVDDPIAQGLLAFFAVYPAIDEHNADTFKALVSEWIANIPPPPAVDPEAFEQDVAAWRRGEFD